MNKFSKSVLMCGLWGAALFYSFTLSAQTNYRLGLSSGPGGATGAGYTVANQKATFINSTTSVANTTNVTVSLSNQQYGNATAHSFEGMVATTYSGAVSFGAQGINDINTAPLSNNRFVALNFFGSPTANHFTINKMATPGTGINPLIAGAFAMAVFTDALIDTLGNNINGITNLNTDIQFADVTLTFNEPVSNPVIHLGGLGGTADVSLSSSSGGRRTWLGYAAVFELLDAYSLTRLSGSAYFDVNSTTKKTKDSATWLGPSSLPSGACFGGSTTYGASGSFVVNAINITSVSFRVYLHSDAGKVTDEFMVIPCPQPDSINSYPFTATAYPRWSDATMIRSDAFTISASFARMKITGNVFNDPDAGNVNNSTGTTNIIPSGIYANLIDTATGFVIKSVAVGTNGVFDLGEYNANGYKVVLSSTLGTAGLLPTAYTAPSGWVNTGAFIGNVNTGNTGNVNGLSEIFVLNEAAHKTNINFAIQQLPESDTLATTIPQPNSNDIIVLDGLGSNPPILSGSDAQDGTYAGATGTVRNPSGVIINTLPVNGVLYYNGNPVIAGDTIANPALLTIVLTGSGYTEVVLEYAYLDAAGYADPTPATYTLNWGAPLPVTIIDFQAYSLKGSAQLQWTTLSEQDNKGFTIQRSKNGSTWDEVGFVDSKGEHGSSNQTLDYEFTDENPMNGTNQYRLKQIDFDGHFEYSIVRLVFFEQPNTITFYPNPSNKYVSIKGLSGKEQIKIYNNIGRLVLEAEAKSETETIDISYLSEGLYYIQINNFEDLFFSKKLLKVK